MWWIDLFNSDTVCLSVVALALFSCAFWISAQFDGSDS
jgi:hypothetical protein